MTSENLQDAKNSESAQPPSSHGLYDQRHGEDPHILPGSDRTPTRGDLERIRQAVRKGASYCHCFFGLGDGGALAFFQFADREDERKFSPPIPETPFHHIALKVDQATQEAIEKRIEAAGYKDPDTFVLEHGYCRSVYIKDPNGLILEFTLDAPNADQIAHDRMGDAQATLARWLQGDHTSNNVYR